MRNPLTDLLSSFGWSIGGSGPQFDQMSLPREDIIAGQELLLGQLNAPVLDKLGQRMAEGSITPSIEYPPEEKALVAQLLASQSNTPVEPMAGNNYYIPELPSEAYDPAMKEWQRAQQADWVKRAEQFRAEEKKKSRDSWEEVAPGVYRKPGETGNQYTNVKDADGTPTMKPPVTGSIVTAQDQLLGANLSSRIAAIRSAPDARTKLELFQQLQTDASMQQAKLIEDMQKQAQIKVGIPQLEERLMQNEGLDRQNSSRYGYVVDSPATKQTRELLDQARIRAAREAELYVKSNMKIHALDSQIKGLGSVLSFDLKNEEKIKDREDRQAAAKDNILLNRQLQQENAVFASAERKAAREEQRQMKEAEDIERGLAQTSAEQRDRIRALVPSLRDQDDEAIARLLSKGKTTLSEQDFAASKEQPENLFPQALAGNTSALKVLVFEEAKRTQRPEQDVMRDLTKVAGMTKDPQALNRAALEIFQSVDSPEYKQFRSLDTAVRSGIATKEQKAAHSQAVASLVTVHNQRKSQQAWLGDLTTWKTEDPVIQTAINKVKDSTGSADIVQVAKTVMEDVPPMQRAQQLDKFKRLIFEEAKTASLISSRDPYQAWSLVQRETSQRLLDKIGSGSLPPFARSLDAAQQFFTGRP